MLQLEKEPNGVACVNMRVPKGASLLGNYKH